MNDDFEMYGEFLAEDGLEFDHDVYLVGCSSFQDLQQRRDADLDEDDFMSRPCIFSDTEHDFKYGALVHCKDCMHC